MARLDRIIALTAAAVIAVLGFLPLANWIPGGPTAPWYPAVSADLLTGLSISVGVAVVLAIVSRRVPALWREGLLDPVRRSAERRWPAWVIGLGAVTLALALWVATSLLDGRPLLIDEIIQVYQARLLALGRLWNPAEPHQEFFSSLHLVEQDGRVYGQFPMGGPAMLALGTLIGREWLVGPAFAAIGVLCFGGLLRRIEPRPGIALGALLLFALAPFAVFMSGSHMNHVTALTWVLLGLWGLSRATAEDAGRFRDGLAAGLGFGIAATIRPVDAFAFAVPAGLWLLARALRRGRLAALLGSGLGIALPMAALAWANLLTTGSPFRFGYSVLWGSGHDLGFHISPWGGAHTPVRGLELLNLYFLRLQSYLFEAAAPSLLPVTAALGLSRKLSAFDRYLLAAGTLLCGCYFAYWHDGFYLGPRFLYLLLPILALWSARLLPALRDRIGTGPVYRGSVYAILIAATLGLLTSAPVRARQYGTGMSSLRWDPDTAAQRAGVRNALILVRESWGAELVARMWALGVPRPEADAIYRGADPCRLDQSLSAMEAGAPRGVEAAAALQPLREDSVKLVNVESITGDPSLRLTPGVRYPPRCLEKIEANRGGFTLFPPLLLARDFGNVYARDLGARDSLLLREMPDRPVYLLKPPNGGVGVAPEFIPLRRDSLLAAWRVGR
jgi:hypothetical protein